MCVRCYDTYVAIWAPNSICSICTFFVVRMGKLAGNKPGVRKKPAARVPTRMPSLPEWAGANGISAQRWSEASRQQKERWRYKFLYEAAAGVASDSGSEESAAAAEVIPLHGPAYREYCISGLDLSVAQEALSLHRWEDDHCLRRLLDILEKGKGSMTFMTFFSSMLDRGRLFSAWPTPLHANKEFRACLLYPQAEQWTDLDMTNAHCYICLYLAGVVGLTLPALVDYIDRKSHWRAMLTKQGVNDRDAKQLWLSLLNSGTVAGWRHKLRRAAPGMQVNLSAEGLGTHLTELRTEIVELRSLVLETEPWTRICKDMAAENKSNSRHRKKEEPLRRSIWNCVLCTVETQVIRALGEYVESDSAARVAMPSYDGLLLHHGPGKFSWSPVRETAWATICRVKWNFYFPVEKKDFLAHLPVWMAEIIRLRAALQQCS